MINQNNETLPDTPNNNIYTNQHNHVNYWMISSLLLLTILLTIVVYPYIFQTRSTLIGDMGEATPTTKTDSKTSDVESSGINPYADVPYPYPKSLSTALSEYCKDNKILLEMLPIGLVPESGIRERYNLLDLENSNEYVQCYPSQSNGIDNNYAKLVNTNEQSTIYLFDNTSSIDGMVNPLEDISNYQDMMIGSQNYFVKVMEPGPYGISTYGVNVMLIAERDYPNINTNVRFISSLTFENNKTIDSLIKKYGTRINNVDEEEYSIPTESQRIKFRAELLKYLKTDPMVVQAAKDMLQDMNGVVAKTFK